MDSFESCLQFSAHPGWQKPSNTPDENSSPTLLSDVSLNESVINLALSVQRGNWDSITQLVQSMYGRLPTTKDDFPVPTQVAPPNTISPDFARYIPWTPRARALLDGKSPPDRSEPKLWNNAIGPRMANVLLCMAKRGRLSGIEISAYLHMVLVDFASGQRTPSAMTETYFGDFLAKNASRDNEWDNLAMNNDPKFVIFGRRQGILSHHWYVIVVDIAAKKAYCFDSIVAQDTRAEHIEAFALLQEKWAIRLPQLPVPEYMIELPSFIQADSLRSGFLCMYHISLLFRSPTHLKKLEHGNMIATREDLDWVIKAAENYIGIKVKEAPVNLEPITNLLLNTMSSDRGGNLGKKQVNTRTKSNALLRELAANKCEFKELTLKETTASKLSPKTGSSLSNLFITGNLDDPGLSFASPYPKCPGHKRSHHKPAPVQYTIKTYRHGSTYHDIVDPEKITRAPAGSAERVAQFRTGVIKPLGIRRGETIEEYASRPLPNRPDGWQGWGWYKSNVAAVHAANLEEHPDQQAARAKLQRKRGRDADLVELDMKTMKPKRQCKDKN
ncbi:hypothetical protein NUW58_g4807 [Xylaria curta]|uniref:Uncharacterized protein n=1 Tax=Xylaria curta TaxID=42375 RepID=A0ACC1P5L0_9PEZI|nr:hypothetical protein NUW58_g4807 [Xylaria curta]